MTEEQDEEEDRVSIIEWIRWVLPPIAYTFLGAAPILLAYPQTPPIFFAFAGALYAACLIRMIVLWINHRDDPRSAKPPPEDS